MLKGVSQYVSAIMLTVIVLLAGSFVLIHAYTAFEQYRQSFQREVIEQQMLATQSIGMLATYIVSNTTNSLLYVHLVVGTSPVKIYSIYINNTLWNDYCSVTIDNETSKPFNDIAGLSIKPLTYVEIVCNLPPNANCTLVKIVYQGGEISSIAITIR